MGRVVRKPVSVVGGEIEVEGLYYLYRKKKTNALIRHAADLCL